MANIFISYRRSDSLQISLNIYKILCEKFGSEYVFIDQEKIPLGEHFPDYLNQKLHWADIILVVIGPTWLTCKDDYSDKYRIEDKEDYVRIEVDKALFRTRFEGTTLIPVSIDEAAIPTQGASIKNIRFPFGLEELQRYNGCNLNTSTFNRDIQKLLDGIESIKFEGKNHSKTDTEPMMVSQGIDPWQEEYEHGGFLKRLPPDALVILFQEGERWEFEIECKSQPFFNVRKGSLNSSVMDGMRLDEAVGVIIEWYAIDPEQCIYQRTKLKSYEELKKRTILQSLSKKHSYKTEWERFRGNPFFSNMHMLIKYFYDRVIVNSNKKYFCDNIPNSFGQVIQQYNYMGHLENNEERIFGEYICSLTTALGGVDYDSKQLYYCPSIPETNLQYVNLKQAPFLVNVRYCAHVGKGKNGYHLVHL